MFTTSWSTWRPSASLLLLCAVAITAFADDDNVSECSELKRPEPPGVCSPLKLNNRCYQSDGDHNIVSDTCLPDSEQFTCISLNKIWVPNAAICKGREDRCSTPEKVFKRNQDVCIAQASLPNKGGDAGAVTSADPPCGPGDGNVSVCAWLCLQPPSNKVFDVASAQFSSKDGPDCWDPAGYADCGPGADCGYSRWEATSVDPKAVCGRFKNWSHNLSRCAEISVRVLP
jgi:hypothetical protein